MPTTKKLRDGDFWRTCERTGRQVPASETRKEWTGAIVDRRVFEHRHPQEFVRGRVDNMSVPEPRPMPTPSFVGPRSTTAAVAVAAGLTSIEVASSSGFTAGDQLLVMLADAETFRVALQDAPDATHLTLAAPLPGAVAVGGVIVNRTAVVEGDIG